MAVEPSIIDETLERRSQLRMLQCKIALDHWIPSQPAIKYIAIIRDIWEVYTGDFIHGDYGRIIALLKLKT